MISAYVQPLFFVFLMICLSLLNCQVPDDRKSMGDADVVAAAIRQDLEDGLSEASRLGADNKDLPAIKYTAEKQHSSVSFRTQHWEIVDLMGWFEDFDIVMYADSSDFSDAVIFGEVNPRSLVMPNPKMAGTAQQAPYIDSENYGKLSFKSSSFTPLEENHYRLQGILKMNGIEKGVVFDVLFNGFAYPGEKPICGFDVTGQINRNDFKVGGDDRLHSGKQVHSDIIFLKMSLRME